MNYEEFKAKVGDGIPPYIIWRAIDSIERAGPDALQKITGFSSVEELLSANKSRAELVSLLESLFKMAGAIIEDATDFETVEEFFDYNPHATGDDIRRIEEALGASLPPDFVRFHKAGYAQDWSGFMVYERNGKYQVETSYADWQQGNFFSAKCDKDGRCELVGRQQGWNWEGKFVKIGEFDYDAYNRDSGHFGFLVDNGICRSEVVWLDHEYSGDDLEKYAAVIADFDDFLSGEENEELRNVNDGGGDEKEFLRFAAYNPKWALDYTRRMLNEDEGVDINSQDNAGNTALKIAARFGHIETMRLLLEHGADVNAQDEDGDTAMMEAVFSGRTDMIHLLLENGANINHQNDDGLTPLMVAASRRRVEAVKLLLEREAKADIENAQGQTARTINKSGKIRQMIEAATNTPPE